MKQTTTDWFNEQDLRTAMEWLIEKHESNPAYTDSNIEKAIDWLRAIHEHNSTYQKAD